MHARLTTPVRVNPRIKDSDELLEFLFLVGSSKLVALGGLDKASEKAAKNKTNTFLTQLIIVQILAN